MSNRLVRHAIITATNRYRNEGKRLLCEAET